MSRFDTMYQDYADAVNKTRESFGLAPTTDPTEGIREVMTQYPVNDYRSEPASLSEPSIQQDTSTTQPQSASAYQKNLFDPITASTQTRQWWDTHQTIPEMIAQLMQDNTLTDEIKSDLYTRIQSLKADPSNYYYYNPYDKVTSEAVGKIAALGVDVSGGINDEWIEQNKYLLNYARYTDTGTTPAAPTKTSTKEQNAAYYYSRIVDDYNATKTVEQQIEAQKQEIAYWVGREDLNLSDQEIMDKITSSGSYKYLDNIQTGRETGKIYNYTAPIDYNPDYLPVYIWQARNNGGSGDVELDGIRAALGMGNTWQENPEISAKLDPANADTYNPYSVGTTLNDAALYFGVPSFSEGWAEEARKTLDWNDKTAVKYWEKVYDAEQFTKQAETELNLLNNRIDTMIGAGITDPDVILDGLWESDYLGDGQSALSALKKMDAGLKNPNDLASITHAIDYRRQDIEAYVTQRCEEATAEKLPAFGARVHDILDGSSNIVHPTADLSPVDALSGTQLPTTPTPNVTPAVQSTESKPTVNAPLSDILNNDVSPGGAPQPQATPSPAPTQAAQAINETRDKTLQAAIPTILTTGTGTEKAVTQYAPSADFATFVRQLSGDVYNGKLTGESGRVYVQQQTDAYTAENYLNAKKVTDEYNAAAASRDQLIQERSNLKGKLELNEILYEYEDRSPYAAPWSPSDTIDIGGQKYNVSADFNPDTGKYDLTDVQPVGFTSYDDRKPADAYVEHAYQDWIDRLNADPFQVEYGEDGEEEYSLSGAPTIDRTPKQQAVFQLSDDVYYYASAKLQDDGNYALEYGGRVANPEAIPGDIPIINVEPTVTEEAKEEAATWAEGLGDLSAWAGKTNFQHLTWEQEDAARQRINVLNDMIQDRQATLDAMQDSYDQAVEQEKLIRNGAQVAALLDIQANAPRIDASGFEGHLAMQQQIKDYTDKAMALPNALNLLDSVGSQYRATEWSATTMFQDYLDKGASVSQVGQFAQAVKTEDQQRLKDLDQAFDKADKAGIEFTDEFIKNLNREDERLKREIQDADDFLLQTRSDFTETVNRMMQDVLSDAYQTGIFPQYKYSENARNIARALAGEVLEPNLENGNSPEATSELTAMFMQDDELSTYLYKLANEGDKAAEEYRKRLVNNSYGVLQTRVSQYQDEMMEQFAKDHPILAAGASILLSPLAVQGKAYEAISVLTGQEINPFNTMYGSTSAQQILNANARETVLAPLEKDSFAYRLSSTVYDALTSGLRSIYNAAIASPVGGLSAAGLMALGASSGDVRNAKFNKASDLQAVLKGAVTFGTEFITEAITTENIADAINAGGGAKGVKKGIASVLKNPFVEELVGEELADTVEYWSDDFITGKLSERQKAIAAYEQTMSHKDAEDKANKDFFRGLLDTALTTLMSTGVTTGTGYAAGYVSNQLDTSNARHAARQPQASSAAQTPKIITPPLVENMAPTARESTSQDVNNPVQPEKTTSDSGKIQAQNPEEIPSPAWKNPDLAARQAAALTASLGADKSSQTATVGAVLLPENADEGDYTVAAAAGVRLAETYSPEKAVDVARVVVMEASMEGVDPETVRSALTVAALGQGEAARVLSEIDETGITGGDVERLIEAASRDMKNPAVAQRMTQNVEDVQVATREKDLIADGALAGVQPYEQALSQARAQEAETQANLEAEQERAQAMGDNLRTVQTQYNQDPTNQAMRGELQQATKDLTGQIKVVAEYQQSLDKHRQDTEAAKKSLDAVRENLMKQVRQQAIADVQAQNQARAEEEARRQQEQLDSADQMPYTGTNEVRSNAVQSGSVYSTQGIDAGQLPVTSGRNDGRGNSVYVGQGTGREANSGGNAGGRNDAQGTGGGQAGLRVLTPESHESLRNNGVTDLPLNRETDRQRFSSALAEGRASNANGVYVDNQSPEDLERKGAIMILGDDGKVGAAVGTVGEEKGNIFAVFKHNDSTAQRASTALMIQAIAEGGDKLDCYAGKQNADGTLHPSRGLAEMYSRTGFIPVARVTFADGINEEWDTDRLGRPPVIFWMHNGDSADVVAQKQGLAEEDGGYHMYTDEELMALPVFDNVTDADGNITEYGYDRAWAYRDQLLDEARKNRNQDGTGLSTPDGGLSTTGDVDSSMSNAVPPTGNGAITPDTNPPAGGGKQRQFGSRTAQRSDALHDEVKEYLRTHSAYDPDSNNAQINRAVDWVRSHATENDPEGYFGAMNEAQSPDFNFASADGQAQMLTLMSMAALKGDVSAEMALADAYNKQGTVIGRALQSRNIFNMMTPLGRQGILMKEMDKINADYEARGKDTRVKLSPETLEAAGNAKTQEDFDRVRKQAWKEMAEQMPPSWKDQLQAWRMLSMLGNPRTHVRNVLGNAIFMPAVKLKNVIGTGLEAAFVKEGSGEARTKSLTVSKENRSFAKADAVKMKDILTGEGKYTPDQGVTRERKAFGTKEDSLISRTVGKALQWLIDKNGDALEAEDWLFLRKHYENALGGWMQANNLTPETITPAQLDQAREYAVNEAQKATYRDASKIASLLSDISRKGGFPGFVVDTALPFKKTPANILKRGIEYSPVGLIKTIAADTAKVAKYNDWVKNGGQGKKPANALSPTQYIDRISAGLSGTAITAMGYMLASMGAVTVEINDDEDKFDELAGKQKYALNIRIGDTDVSYTVDWAAPVSLPFFVGASIYDAIQGDIQDVGQVADALLSITEPVFNLSMLDGVNSLMQTSQWSSGNAMTQIGEKLASNYVSSFIPTLAGQVSRTIDPTRRKSYVESGASLSTWQYALEQVQNKTPFSVSNIPYRDVWGNEDRTSEWLAAFENFISPGYISGIKPSDVEKELAKLYDETQDKAVIPKDASKTLYVNGENVKLNAEQYDQYVQARGTTAQTLLEDLFSRPEWAVMDGAAKVDLVSDVWTIANETARAELFPDAKKTAWVKEATEQGNTTDKVLERHEEQAKTAYVKGYNTALKKAVEDGDMDSAQTSITALLEAGKDVSGIRSSLTSTFKPIYKEAAKKGDQETMDRIQEMLTSLPLGKSSYKLNTIIGWGLPRDE